MSRLILNVKPVHRYREPGYPSHADPDPLRGTGAPRYPWARGFAAMMASVGIVSTAFGDEVSIKPSDHPNQVSVELNASTSNTVLASNAGRGNPFDLQYAKAPPAIVMHFAGGFGVGTAEYIDKEIAREVVEKTFRKQRVEIRQNYPIFHDNAKFIADGYDKETKIGYKLVDINNHNSEQNIILLLLKEHKSQKKKTDESLASLKSMIKRYIDGVELPLFKSNLEKLMSCEDRIIANMLVSLCINDYENETINKAEMAACDERARAGEEFIAIISVSDRRFVPSTFSAKSSMLKRLELKAIQSLPDGKIKNEAHANYLESLEEKAAEDSLRALEKAVREYIEWARNEGMQ